MHREKFWVEEVAAVLGRMNLDPEVYRETKMVFFDMLGKAYMDGLEEANRLVEKRQLVASLVATVDQHEPDRIGKALQMTEELIARVE